MTELQRMAGNVGAPAGDASAVAGQLFETFSQQDIALQRFQPFTPSSVYPSEHLERVNIRGPYQTGIRLDGCWNATISDPFINGPLGDEAEYGNPQQMQVGIDLVGAMDCEIAKPHVTCANVGVRARTHPDGFPRSEDFNLTGGWLMHVNTGVELTGSHLGGWPTPCAHIQCRHIAFNKFAITATDTAFLKIVDTNCYASHYTRTAWCIYLVRCKHVQIRGCEFWSNWPPGAQGFFGGIVLDQCEDVTITDGEFAPSITLALHATASCKNVRTNGKVWDELAKAGKVANYAS